MTADVKQNQSLMIHSKVEETGWYNGIDSHSYERDGRLLMNAYLLYVAQMCSEK